MKGACALEQEEGFKVFSVCFNWLLSGLYSVKKKKPFWQMNFVLEKGDGFLCPSALEEKMMLTGLLDTPSDLGKK